MVDIERILVRTPFPQVEEQGEYADQALTWQSTGQRIDVEQGLDETKGGQD